MGARVTSLLRRPGPLGTLVSHMRLGFRLVREPRVPVLTKALPLLAALYVISPFDFLPDVLPVLGQFDDLGISLIALELFLRLCPRAAVAFHSAAIAQSRRYSPMSSADDFIDAEWHRQD